MGNRCWTRKFYSCCCFVHKNNQQNNGHMTMSKLQFFFVSLLLLLLPRIIFSSLIWFGFHRILYINNDIHYDAFLIWRQFPSKQSSCLKNKRNTTSIRKRNENTANNGWALCEDCVRWCVSTRQVCFANILFMPINFRQTYVTCAWANERVQVARASEWVSEWVWMTVLWPIEIQDLCFC